MISQSVQTANATPPHTGGTAQCQPSKRHPCESSQTPQIPPSSSGQHSTPSHQTPPSSSDAPIATSGNNIYIAWWDNKTGNNDEVMFKSSTDGGKTFGDKINLSNTTKSESQDAQIDTFGDNDNNVIVTWWERNATSNEPVARISTDSGKTFGQIMKLSTNGTIGK
jgi:hypothetical protein